MKVYCYDCKHRWSGADWWTDDQCRHPDNMMPIDTPLYHYEQPYTKLAEMNKNNDCKLYQRKWWKFWIAKNV